MKIQALIKLRINAGQASSKEPVGPTLGQFGIPIMDFCNKFNSATQKYIEETLLNVVIFFFGNQKYEFIIKLPSFIYFAKRSLEEEIIINKPGYLTLPLTTLLYLTPFMLYEILNYYNMHSNLNNVISKIDIKKLLNSIKSSGLLVFSY